MIVLDIIKLNVGINATNCYIIKYQDNTGIIIDPGADGDKLLGKIDKLNLTIEKIILTHGHFDHIGALDKVREKTGAHVYIHQQDAEYLVNPDKNLSSVFSAPLKVKPADRIIKENDMIDNFIVIHTPGHTQGGICLYNDKENILFSGDTIFARGVGRTDHPDGDQAQLFDSIKKKLVDLSEETTFYPGHGAKSTIGEFKTFFKKYTL